MSVGDRWHLAHPPKDAKRCSQHRKVPSAEHGIGLRWQVRGHTDADGRPVPKENFEFEQGAKDRDAELKVAVKTGTLIDEKGGQVTFEKYAEQFRKTRSHDHSTAERVEQQLRNHCYSGDGRSKTPTGRVAIGDHSMIVLARRVSLIRDWISDMALSEASKLLVFNLVLSIFDAAIDDKIIGSNPLKAKSVDKPKPVRAEVTAWTAEQITAVAEALPARLRAMAYLGGVTGPRQGELFGLALGDLDFLRRTVRYEIQVARVGKQAVFKPIKNDKARTVPVAVPVIPVLSEHVRRFPAAEVTLPWSEKGSKKDGQPVTRTLVFTDPAGASWEREQANRPWRRAWKSAGIPDKGRANGWHVLRHSAASEWLSRGLNPAMVSAFLGDSLGVVLATYSHWLPQDDDRGRAIMDGFLTPGVTASLASEFPDSSLVAR